jgi:hypothetical protein
LIQLKVWWSTDLQTLHLEESVSFICPELKDYYKQPNPGKKFTFSIIIRHLYSFRMHDSELLIGYIVGPTRALPSLCTGACIST